MQKAKYRYDIACCLLIPFLMSNIIVYVCPYFMIENITLYCIRCIVIMFGCLGECLKLREEYNKASKDKGVVSGLIISMGVSIFNMVAYTPYLKMFKQKNVEIILVIVGSVIVLGGIVLRYFAKKGLQKYFSHTVQIMKKHQLIKEGIYSYMRHPAYVGTFLILCGVMIMYNNYLALLFLFVGTPLGLKRIQAEERLLISHFGEEYISYKKQVNRFIPIRKRKEK